MSIVIIDEIVSAERLEQIEDILMCAWDREIPSLIKNYGLPALQQANYRILIEVVDVPE